MEATWDTHTHWYLYKQQIDEAYDRDDYTTVVELSTRLLDNRPPPLTEDLRMLVRHLQRAGYSAQRCGLLDHALHWHEESVTIAKALQQQGDHGYLADALHYLGDTHIQRDEKPLAYERLKESLKATEEKAIAEGKTGEPEYDRHILHDVGWLAYTQAKYTAATEYLTLCYHQSRRAKDHEYELQSLEYLTFVAKRTGDVALARQHYEEAVICTEFVPRGTFSLGGHPILGAMARDIGENEFAYFHFSRALKMARHQEDCPTVARLLRRLAPIARELNRLEEAQKYSEEAVAYWEAHPPMDRWEQSEQTYVLSECAEIADLQKRYNTALENYIYVCLRFQESTNHRNVIYILVNIALMLDHLKREQEATSLFIALRELARQPDYQEKFRKWENDTIEKFVRYHRFLLLSHRWQRKPVMTYEEMLAFIPTLIPAVKNSTEIPAGSAAPPLPTGV